jgi:hypothetical protein
MHTHKKKSKGWSSDQYSELSKDFRSATMNRWRSPKSWAISFEHEISDSPLISVLCLCISLQKCVVVYIRKDYWKQRATPTRDQTRRSYGTDKAAADRRVAEGKGEGERAYRVVPSRWPQPAPGEGAPTGGGKEERRRRAVDGGWKGRRRKLEKLRCY